jgi:polysaccharide chain length determinant protein (PEP-CTERM system associated)
MDTLYDDVRGTLHSIWQRRWVSLAVAWGVCVLGWLAVAMVPNTYESHARVFIQLYDPLSAQVGIGAADIQHNIDQVRNTLTSTAHMEQLVKSTRLGENVTSKRDMDNAVASLAKTIKITADQDNLFQISATASGAGTDGESARLAQTIVSKMIDIFRDEGVNNNRDQAKRTMDFLDQQVAQQSAQLQSAEQRRIEFEAKYPEAAAGGISLIQRLEQSRAEMRSMDADIAAAQSALASVGGQMASTPATISAMGPGGGARGQLSQLQADLAGMRARGLTENHPDVIATRNQIASLQQQVRAEGNGNTTIGVPNPAYQGLQAIKAEREANLQALQARRASVEGDAAKIAAAQASNPEIVGQAQEISRDYDVLKGQYDKLLSDREALKMRSTVQNGSNAVKLQVIDPPSTPRKPIAPNRPLLLFVVLLAGVAAGIGVAYASGEMRSSFGTTAKLERGLGLPVLGAITRTMTDAASAESRRRLGYFYAASGALGGLFVLLIAIEFIQRGMVA